MSHRNVAYLTWSSGNGTVVQPRRRSGLLIGAVQRRHSLEHNTIGEDGAAATAERPSLSAVVEAVH